MRRPYDDKGRFIRTACPLCGYGYLEYEEHGVWSCNGLIDPNNPNKPLEACLYSHIDGQTHEAKP